MKFHVLYHAHCCDGFCAAWIMSKVIKPKVEAVYTAMNYGDPLPEFEPDDIVIMVDYSRPREELIALKERVQDLVVLDHHKTAQKDLEGLLYCFFDLNHSGAMLALGYLETTIGDPAPRHIEKLAEYVQDRDLWRFELPDSKAINAAIQVTPKDFESYDSLANALYHDHDGIAAGGLSILCAEAQYTAGREFALARFPGPNLWAVPVLNNTHLISEVLHHIGKGYPFAASWFQRPDGKFVYSLRSPGGGADVSVIAKHFGGGGHKHAAGFMTDALVHAIVDPCPTSESSKIA